MALADKYHDPNIFERELRLSWTKAQVEMSHLKIDSEEAHLFQRLAARVVYSDPSLRPTPHVLALNTKAQSSLWAYGISGDLPIVVARINKADDLRTVQETHSRARVSPFQRTQNRSGNPERYADELYAGVTSGTRDDRPYQWFAGTAGQTRRSLFTPGRPDAGG